jgi:hypothetical protein
MLVTKIVASEEGVKEKTDKTVPLSCSLHQRASLLLLCLLGVRNYESPPNISSMFQLCQGFEEVDARRFFMSPMSLIMSLNS